MWKKTLCMLLFVALSTLLPAQTTVTATVVDSDTTAWANATFTARYVGPTNPNPLDIPAIVTGTLNSSGVMSVALTDVSRVQPIGPYWKKGWVFTVCPAISNPTCYSTPIVPITGTSMNVSNVINAVIVAPRMSGGTGVSAYADAEVSAMSNATYYNVISSAQRCYTTSWGVCITSNTALPANGCSTYAGAQLGCTTVRTNPEYDAGTCTTAVTLDPVHGNRQKLTLTDAQTCVLTFTQPATGTVSLAVRVIAPAVGTGQISGGYWPTGTGFTTTPPTLANANGVWVFAICFLDGTHTSCGLLQ